MISPIDRADGLPGQLSSFATASYSKTSGTDMQILNVPESTCSKSLCDEPREDRRAEMKTFVSMTTLYDRRILVSCTIPRKRQVSAANVSNDRVGTPARRVPRSRRAAGGDYGRLRCSAASHPTRLRSASEFTHFHCRFPNLPGHQFTRIPRQNRHPVAD